MKITTDKTVFAVPDIADRMNLALSTVHRLLQSLPDKVKQSAAVNVDEKPIYIDDGNTLSPLTIRSNGQYYDETIITLIEESRQPSGRPKMST